MTLKELSCEPGVLVKYNHVIYHSTVKWYVLNYKIVCLYNLILWYKNCFFFLLSAEYIGVESDL